MRALRSTTPSVCELHPRFLNLLPKLETHAGIYFRFVTCPQNRADCVAETVALAWKWFVALGRRGKDANEFPVTFCRYAARAVGVGRRLCGKAKSKDVMNEREQQRLGFTVGTLPNFTTLGVNPLMEALHDNTRTPPPDAAAFRIDWPAWLKTRTQRDRRLIDRMVMSDRTGELAHSFGLSPARVSQLRREYQADWRRFHGEGVVAR